MMSLYLDVQSHPLVGRHVGDLCGNQRGVQINESADNMAILWSQFSCVSFRIFIQFRIFDISLKGCIVNRLLISGT